ncbi:predicted protein [Micromonas commoda]|uniref:Uncharacterized protein n=1 Tax=Micromonas commoda (strain RCC299 / NOUM17 / CCMP2709) TaxID=296587 RepID=C1E7J3_MICCC|nr:predicted protein [Micromonas commoda]ACO64342.1 predicted protein [Micromonas commoda]|eukprot:XP_002503084.1 predicted protein [Micromonas commoda]
MCVSHEPIHPSKHPRDARPRPRPPGVPISVQTRKTRSPPLLPPPDSLPTPHPSRPSPQRGIEHPGDIAEAASLSSIALPPLTYPLFDTLGDDIVATGKLSKLQLEGVAYACQKHCELLPDGARAGFMIGDGAGVGKGRQISGIILDNYSRGRRRHLWISSSVDLHRDAERDLRDLGCYLKVINGCQELDREGKRAFGLPKDFREGVLFLTYATLVSRNQRGSRLEQILEWFGGEHADGCVLLDECHKAKNFDAGAETGSKVAACVIELQRRCPDARVVYCSATGISEIGNMAYMQRLGFWGEGTPFGDADSFIKAMKNRGVGFLEMLAMEMKASGKYVSRGLSFRQAEFASVEATLTEKQTRVYNEAAAFMSSLRACLAQALTETRTSSNRGQAWKAYWSTHQRFFKLLCVSMKVPSVVEQCRRALREGKCAVIGLQTTGEAAEASLEMSPGMRVDAFVSTTREMLLGFIRTHFPVYIEDVAAASDANGGHPDGQSLLNPGLNPGTPLGPLREHPDCVEARRILLEQADRLDLPPNFLDELIDQLGGPRRVAEMTGRRGRIVRVSRNNFKKVEQVDGVNLREKTAFQRGAKLVAIISDAASTGISLHARRDEPNQRRRVHVTIELPWSADKAIQQLGRTHRSNQSSGPIYLMTSTNLGGERRFAAAVARRLQSLGALTRGDRRAATGVDLSEGNLDSPLGRRALKKMYDALVLDGTPLPPGAVSPGSGVVALHAELRALVCSLGVQVGLLAEGLSEENVAALIETGGGTKDQGDVRRFLNRILGLSVRGQNLLFGYFTEVFEAEVKAAKAEGKYSEGVSDLSGSNIHIAYTKTVLKDPMGSGAELRHSRVLIDRGVSFDKAKEILDAQRRLPKDGFYRMRREMYGRTQVILALAKPGARNTFSIYRPNTGASFFEMDVEELDTKYRKYEDRDEELARHPWAQTYELTERGCMHGASCAVSRDGTGRECTAGSRQVRCCILSGAVVPAWGALEHTLERHEHRFNKSDRGMRAVKVIAEDGTKVVGIRYPEDLLPEVRERIVRDWFRNQERAEEKARVDRERKASAQLAAASGGAGGEGDAVLGGGGLLSPGASRVRVEAPTEVDPRCAARATREPKTMMHFFQKRDDDGGGERTQTRGDAPETRKRPAAAPASVPAGKPRVRGSSTQPTIAFATTGSQLASRPGGRVSNGGANTSKAQSTGPGPGVERQRCPICDLAFPGTWLNGDVNAHIDECIANTVL